MTSNILSHAGELVVFEVDGAGKVERVETDGNYIYPLAEW